MTPAIKWAFLALAAATGIGAGVWGFRKYQERDISMPRIGNTERGSVIFRKPKRML